MSETNTDWLLAQAKKLAEASKTYEDQAFYTQLAEFIQQQAQRLESAQGELDGRTWDHSQW